MHDALMKTQINNPQDQSHCLIRSVVIMDGESSKKIEKWIMGHRCVVFMKGSKEQPKDRCTAEMLNLLDKFCVNYSVCDVNVEENFAKNLALYSGTDKLPLIYINGKLFDGDLTGIGRMSHSKFCSTFEPYDGGLNKRIYDLINAFPVMLFMKGTKTQPRCGFSKEMLEVLNQSNVDYATYNILDDNDVREGLKIYSNWHTYPQLYVNGNLIGGLDVVKQMMESNQLEKNAVVPQMTSVLDVKSALQEFLEGNSMNYCSILSILNEAQPEEKELSRVLMGLKLCVSMLVNRSFQKLVSIIFNLDWMKLSGKLIRTHVDILIQLTLADVSCVDNVLMCFVKKLKPGTISPTCTVEDDDNENAIKRRIIYTAAHRALKKLFEIYPVCVNRIFTSFVNAYPYHGQHTVILRDYARNLLHSTQYLPHLERNILGLIIEEMTKNDVMHDMSNRSVTSAEGIFEMELDKSETASNKQSGAHQLLNKLDICLSDLLSFLQNECFFPDGNLNENRTDELFESLISVFIRSVLPLRSSSVVQFIWFYMCSLRKKYYRQFVQLLWECTVSASVSSPLRLNAASYLGSFIARASFIPIEEIMKYLLSWTQWIQQYICEQDDVNRSHPQLHCSFYCICQAVFYIFSFRCRELINLTNGYDNLVRLNLHRIVTCELNPLQYCSNHLVRNFANVSRNYQLAFCYVTLERNDRLKQLRLVAEWNLGNFFPFDPQPLRRSFTFIEDVYKEYDQTLAEQWFTTEEEECNSGDTVMDDFLDEAEHLSAASLRNSFTYCSSPGFVRIGSEKNL
ncbi:RNA polymerase I-specific transcription initiation factor RRN3 [Trichinella sp. T8]|nr:RNA polymerase I-specific transcription initiation factor RRN3 [Trichinella sp. T8]